MRCPLGDVPDSTAATQMVLDGGDSNFLLLGGEHELLVAQKNLKRR